MKELYYEGSIQYSAMRDEIGEEAIDEMIVIFWSINHYQQSSIPVWRIQLIPSSMHQHLPTSGH